MSICGASAKFQTSRVLHPDPARGCSPAQLEPDGNIGFDRLAEAVATLLAAIGDACAAAKSMPASRTRLSLSSAVPIGKIVAAAKWKDDCVALSP